MTTEELVEINFIKNKLTGYTYWFDLIPKPRLVTTEKFMELINSDSFEYTDYALVYDEKIITNALININTKTISIFEKKQLSDKVCQKTEYTISLEDFFEMIGPALLRIALIDNK